MKNTESSQKRLQLQADQRAERDLYLLDHIIKAPSLRDAATFASPNEIDDILERLDR